jgi:fructokinase
MHHLTVFGEVLFDCFPSGERVLGGAPFNVAWHLQAFGQQPLFVSRVGKDEAGKVISSAMGAWGMDTVGLQHDALHATGQVQVSLNQGEPSYDIVDGVAYDFIDAQQLDSPPCRMLYHGSLGLRNEVSRKALEHLKQTLTPVVFMDVNLRAPWWQREQVLEWVRQADWVKLNEEELALLQGRDRDVESHAAAFLRQYQLEGLVVTRGAKGASLLMRDQASVEVAPVAALQVVDTVGAGDALASVLLLGLNLGWPMSLSLERAQHFASAVVGQRGATVDQPEFYHPFLKAWGLAENRK